MSLQPGTSLNHYRIIASLGEGGMGQVYRAHDLHLDRAVAIKLIAPEVTEQEEIAARFEREARLLAALNHPNVATLYSIDRADAVRFLVMELVEGVTLDTRLHEGGFSVVESLEVAQQIAQALEAAHERNIVHRDLKPANVMLTPQGRVKLVDFGIAKAFPVAGAEPAATRAPDLTATGYLIGTGAYMSPEQVRGHAVDARADIWAFGCVLYELLTGQRLFAHETMADTLAAILEHDAELGQLPDGCAASMEPLLRRCLQRDAESRARDVWHLRLDIEEALRSSRESGQSAPCFRCGQQNPAANAYCNHCGAPQQAACAACGLPAPPGAAFCGGCGSPLAEVEPTSMQPVGDATPHTPSVAARPQQQTSRAPAAAPEIPTSRPARTASVQRTTGGRRGETGERRHATVLALRLAGYHDLVEQLSAEPLDSLAREFEAVACRAIEELGGTVEETSDAAVGAVFGVPRVREDDAQRGVLCALQIRERLSDFAAADALPAGSSLELAAGVCTGAVVVRADTGSGRDKVVAGRCHARAEQLANHALGVSGLLVSPTTARLIETHFDTEPLAPFTFIGHQKPASPYRVTGRAETADRFIARDAGGLTTLVGREAELEVLRQGWREAAAGNGQLITVVGEAGLGKSRLLYEFSREIDPAQSTALVGRCQSHGANVPYLPFIDVLSGMLGDAGAALTADRVAAGVMSIAAELADYVPLYLRLLSIESECYPLPRHMERNLRFGITQGLTALFTEASQAQPRIMILEDWHWADEGSRDVLRQLASMAVGFPLLLLTAYRPEYEADWARGTNHTPLHLVPLTADDSADVMCAVLGSQSVSADLAELIHVRAAGNPFFVEELCRTLLEKEALRVEGGQVLVEGALDALELPETIQAVLRARFDQLDADQQEVLRLGSVIGREFSGPLIESVFAAGATRLEETLASLQELGLIRQTRVLPEPGYRFQNALIREVAYDTLLPHQKGALHGLVGTNIEELYPHRLEEQLDLLGEHFGAAGAWRQAVAYSDRAAVRADQLGQFKEAMALLSRADGWLDNLPESAATKQTRVDMLMRLERLNEALGHKSAQQACIDRLLELLDPDEPSTALAEVYVRQGELLTLMHRYDPAEQTIEQALQIADQLADAVLRRKALRSLAFLRWQQGRAQDAIDLTEQALEIDRQRGEADNLALDLANMAASLKDLGEFDRALELAEEAASLYRSVGQEARQVEPLHIAATVFRSMGDSKRAIEYLERARKLGVNHRSSVHLFWELTQLGNVHISEGDAERGLAYLQEGIDLGRMSGYAQGLSQSLRAMGMGLLAVGRAQDAVPYLQETAEMFRDLEEPQNEVVIWAEIAAAYEQLGQTTDAIVARERVVRLRRDTDDQEGELVALMALAATARQQEGEVAARALDQAVIVGHRCGRLDRVGEALNTLGIMARGAGDAEAALAHFEAALEVFVALQDDTHRGLMLNSLGVVLKELGRLQEAEARLTEALDVNRAAGEQLLEGHALASLGDVALQTGAGEVALEHFRASLEIRRAIGDRIGEGWMLHRAARAAAATGDREAAAEYASDALELAEQLGAEDLLSACSELRTGSD